MTLAFSGALALIWSILVAAILLLIPILWIIAILNLVKQEQMESTQKLIWLLIILIFPVLGSVLYFLLRDKI